MVVTHADNVAVTVEEDVAAEMRDGTVLRADVYHPSDGGHHPVLVCRTPYWKRLDRYVKHARGLAARGYTAVVQDIRGRYASEGDFEWLFGDPALTSDADDGYDTIKWAAALKWSDGQAGTWGHSYPSWCIWQMAPKQPPHLKAIFASGMGKDILAMTNGVFETGRRLEWTYMMAADARRRAGDSSGPYLPVDATRHWREVERGKWIWFLPLDEIPDHVFSTLTPLLKSYYRQQGKELWSFGAVHSQVEVPVCQFTGWWDRLIGTVENFRGMVENGPAGLRDQHRLVIGPWGHNATEMHGRLGPVDHGPAASETFENLITRWYDHRFKGLDNGLAAEPPIRLFVLNENRWRFENEWPLARTEYTDFFLHSDGSANTVRGDGSLSTDEPGGERPDQYEYDPRDPVMSMMGADAQAAPRDQSPLDARRDVLVYQTPALDRELEVVGAVEVRLWAASTAPDTDFTAKLSVVYENGLAVNLSYGIVRARYRDGYDEERLLEPGQPEEYTIRLNPTGILFRPGQRIRLDIASADFPNFDRNHNTGANFWEDPELRTAQQTVFHDRERPSRVVLPVIPR